MSQIVRRIFAKCAAKFLNYEGFLCWKAAQIVRKTTGCADMC